jgi:hypothetical protein
MSLEPLPASMVTKNNLNSLLLSQPNILKPRADSKSFKSHVKLQQHWKQDKNLASFVVSDGDPDTVKPDYNELLATKPLEPHAQPRQWAGHTILATQNDIYSEVLKEDEFKTNQFEHFSKPFTSNLGGNKNTRQLNASKTRNSTTVYKRKYIQLTY